MYHMHTNYVHRYAHVAMYVHMYVRICTLAPRTGLPFVLSVSFDKIDNNNNNTIHSYIATFSYYCKLRTNIIYGNS